MLTNDLAVKCIYSAFIAGNQIVKCSQHSLANNLTVKYC